MVHVSHKEHAIDACILQKISTSSSIMLVDCLTSVLDVAACDATDPFGC